MTLDLGATGSTTALDGLRILDARAEDLPEVSRLIRTSNSYQGAYLAQVADRELDVSYLQSARVRVALVEGEMAGFFSIEAPGRGGAGEGELDWMIVSNGHQGRGLGRVLLDDAVALTEAMGLSALVIVAHPPASGFYRACGADLVGVLPPQGRATWTRDIYRLAVS